MSELGQGMPKFVTTVQRAAFVRGGTKAIPSLFDAASFKWT